MDNQDNQIQQFKGSIEGTTIQNLKPGNYTVNEIKHLSGDDQLVDSGFEVICSTSNGFPDGGEVTNSTSNTSYVPICFEYEDEQGIDCNPITIAAGEEKTCTVKNYINFGQIITG